MEGEATRIRGRDGPKGELGLPLHLSDVVLVSMGVLAAAYLAIAGRWVPGAGRSAVAFALLGLGPLVLRWLARRKGGWRGFDVVATFWLLPAAILGHAYLGPLVDAVRPVLVDRELALADLRLFGVQPAVFLEARTPPWLVEILLLCYYTYFFWPFLLGVVLFRRGDRRVMDEYVLAIALLFTTNFAFYAFVPAVGPRFFLAGELKGPLEGLWLTATLDSLMRNPGFMRDCFPSGHTAVTLAVLGFAFVRVRWVFWLMLPFATGLIAATVVCRFHYVVDLLAAVPFMLLCTSIAAVLARARPAGVRVPTPDLARLRSRSQPLGA